MRWWLAIALAVLAWAQTFPLETLHVQGNNRIPEQNIVSASGLKIGAPVVKADFDKARSRLLETGAFTSVGYEFKPGASGKGYDAVFEVVEVEQLFPYRFEDLKVPDDALRAELKKQEPLFGDQIPAAEDLLHRYASAIERFTGTKVIGKLITDVPGQPAIIFRPPTPRANIAEVRFLGNDALPTSLLTNTLAEVAIGVPYTEPTIRLLLESSIRRLYDARGRIRVEFPKIETEPSKTVDGVAVTVTVNEGSSYNLGTVRVVGIAKADVPEMLKTANFRTGDIANFDEIKAGLDRVYSRYKSKGYLHVTGRIDRDVHDQEHAVDLTVTIEPGSQFIMGKLEIVGLDITSEPAIRKFWSLKPGAPFQPEYPEGFLNNVREQGIFDNLGKTRAETRIDEKANVVDVTLYFSGSGADKKKTSP
jgi:outer membrane protein insertion porin family